MQKYKPTPEEEVDIEMVVEPYAFEKYCGACNNFNTQDCPFLGKVNNGTNWREAGCQSFWD